MIAEITLANGTKVGGTPVNTPDGLDLGVIYTWNYEYDPDGGANGQGELTVEILADGTSMGTSVVTLSTSHRNIGAKSLAFPD